ncbi:putative transcription factor C2H2 family [Helianthus annuus]|uniref:RING-type E3 ubiquitin transferase n=1 Tax=Helianthus annuus TaxID=4232 RepID=A0A251TQ55_HELAN|nr:E3 ubiquitin-protein ligase XBAT32 [Helianthus annuus]KAF5787545.1 putative transcription factor C2H2 family [Helianthus annuus]KAJ0514754.1 putative transcription factor C2H2 family [Helianthus annuus]KAJ0523044.1 putative transcription factor C2H2 family [Helianthus annuus]KAJ0530908.1 putative transcription factor C2H2 family [Helianthus annuus]KAJ0701133.1 putative transcription factor C2H2 family [Helianthus annuus]
MRFFSLMGNSFGCSASGERLVSAARDGDVQEAKALLEYNPRLARYSTFGVRNSPLHYSAAQGHHEIVSLLVESGVDINLRNYRGQTALMQACQYGHWEVVLTLILYKANIHKADYLNGGTALHLAALNGHSRCIRILLADYIPSVANFYNFVNKRSGIEESVSEFDEGSLYETINRPADGGVTALHMAALNGHVDSVQLLVDLGASVNEVTVDAGATIDLIGAGSTPLHYAACGGNAQCCQYLISRGASLTAENAKGWTPLAVARSWNRDWLEEVLVEQQQVEEPTSSPYLCLPLMSVVRIARECGWSDDSLSLCADPCAVCLENKCAIAAEGCFHEFCTRCALYLCSTSTASNAAQGPPGSIPCPLCRQGIVSFKKLPGTRAILGMSRTSLPLSFFTCTSLTDDTDNIALDTTPLCKPEFPSPLRSLSCQKFPSMKLSSSLCMGASDTSPSLSRSSVDSGRYSRSSFRRSNSHSDSRRSWLCSLNQSLETG